jgi:hypothetical protein
MARFGFNGGSYAGLSPNVNAEDTINFFDEIADGAAKTPVSLLPTAGLLEFAAVPGAADVRGEFAVLSNATPGQPGIYFAAIGTQLYRVNANGTLTAYTQVIVDDGQPVYFAAGPNGSAGGGVWQLLFCSGGTAYVVDLTVPPPAGITVLPAADFNNSAPVAQVAYCDGYFLALLANTNQFQVSALLNALDWTSLAAFGAQAISVFTDNVLFMVESDRLLFFAGPKQSVWFYDSGDPNFPFTVIPGSMIEEGTIAANSWQKIANDIFFLGGDERGAGIVRRMTGQTPTRISNFAVELSIQNMATFADAIAYSKQDRGHTFYVLYFPTGNLTWAYDLTTNQWHKEAFWNEQLGQFDASLARCHMYAFGKHLVGARNSGIIYDMSQNYFTDNGNPIRRLRRAPHVSTEQEWIFHKKMQIDVEMGDGPMVLDTLGNERPPRIFLRWSDDGAHTWGNYHQIDCGKLGEYKFRAMIRRMGKSRDRVYEMTVDDPISWRIVDSYLTANPGYATTESLKAQYRKMGVSQ